MKARKLKATRKKLRYSMQDMADQLQIPKSTYARYEDGSAAVPEEISYEVAELVRKDREWFLQMDKRIEDSLTTAERICLRSA